MSKKADKEKNQHIQVFVRCRPINGKEKKQGAFNVVEVSEREVHVKDRSVATAPTKTFSFDKVYGPNSKQIDVHKHVVSPLVEEVLSGYNCTVFAYGQTGTGKTFTMEGERTEKEDLSWEDDPLAGIIPRAMHQLFTHLTLMEVKLGCEFSVRVSFLEIYNEELIDLLGAESVENPRLRIYEDSARKGSCIIQGLEEVVVRNKDEVYKIMALGSERRQTAATQMNAHSSRSHSLFMVTVHIKENSVDGEEMLKTGKLNLVDLAGSECIGRSGAIDKRAREAGNINQSLLTLGRVITALVEHAPHVPYRESKLTRLLQDSLGGRTKTSIIATISPASLNLDETLSTLDYAFRAKNITNRPEINQRLSKKTLLKEYNEEIERLRRDLQAARDKNGVFLAQENYDEMQIKIQQQRDSIIDLTERMATLTSEMIKIQDLFTETKEELASTEEELTETKGDLNHTKDVLDRTRLNYQVTIQDRDEQRYLVTKHVKSENQLSAEATCLLNTTNDATTDVDGLHAKLDRKRKVEQHNEAVLENFRVSFRKSIDDIKNNLKDFTTGQIKSASSIKSAIGAMGARRAEEVDTLCQDLGQMETMLTSRLTKLEEKEEARIANNKQWSAGICKDCVQVEEDQETEELKFHEQTFLASMLKIHTSLKQRYDSLQQLDALRQSQMEMQQAQIARFAEEMEERLKLQAELATSLTSAMEKSLADHKQQLQHTIQSHSSLSQQLEDQLITSLKEKVREMITSQQTTLESNVMKLEKTDEKMSADVQSFSENSASGLTTALSATQQGVANVQELTAKHSTALHDTITKETDELKTIIDDKKTLEVNVTTFKQQRKENRSKYTKLITERVEHHMASLSDCHNTFKDGIQSATKEYSAAVGRLKQGQNTEQAALTSDVASQQDQLDSLSKTISDCSESMTQAIENRDAHVEKLLTEETQKDMPTGTTPQVRDFIYPRDLTRTQRHSMILQEFRRSYVTRDVADLPLPNNSFDSVSSEVSPLDLDADIDVDGQSVDQNASADSAISSASFASASTIGEQSEIVDLPKDASEEGKENAGNMKPPKIKTVPKTTRTTQDRSRSRSQSSRDRSLTRKTPKKVAPSTSGTKTPTATAGTQRQSRTRLPLRTANSAN